MDRRFPLVTTSLTRQWDRRVCTLGDMGLGDSAEVDGVGPLKFLSFLQEPHQCVRGPSSTIRAPTTTIDDAKDHWFPMVLALIARQRDRGVCTLGDVGLGDSAEVDGVGPTKFLSFLQEPFQRVGDISSTVRAPATSGCTYSTSAGYGDHNPV